MTDHYDPNTEKKLMVVSWLDHFSRSNWHDADDPDLVPLEVVSVGWVSGEDDVMIALSSGLTEGGKSVNTVSILKVAIVDSYEVVFK